MNASTTLTVNNPIIRRVALLFAMLMVAFTLSIASPTAAHATTTPGGVGAQKVPSLCGTAGDEKFVDYLPVFRWSSETSNMHTRYSKLDLSGYMGGFTDRAVTNITFGLGNASWNATTSVVTLANRACPIDAVGGMVDKYAGKLGKAVIDSGIVVVFVVAAIIGVAWRGYRSGGQFRFSTLVPKIMILGVLLIMINGAAQSTGGGINGSNKQYTPGLGSPGWIATTIDEVVSTLAQAPVAVMMEEDTFAIGGLSAGTDNSKTKNAGSDYSTSCRYYVRALHDLYKERNKKAFVDVTGTSRALSSMWEQSGLRAWRQVQFGDKSNAGNRMYCYALESKKDIEVAGPASAPTKVGTMAEVMAKAKMGLPSEEAPVFARTSDVKTFDMQMVALAQCRVTNGNVAKPNVDLYQLAKKDTDKPRITDADCAKAFKPGEKMPEVFDWPPRVGGGFGGIVKGKGLDGDDTVSKYAISTGGQKDFLNSLHGGGGGAGSMLTGIFYMVSSVFVLISFGVLSAAILLAKMAALIFLFMFIFVAVGNLLPNSDPGKFPRLFKQYAGVSFFIFGFQLIMAMLAFLTKILVDMGTETIGNEQMEMLWVGMAPALALLAMHLGFKKMGVPSPLSVNAGQAWGKAAQTGSLGQAALVGGGALGGGLLAGALNRGAIQSALGNQISDRWSAARGAKGTKEKTNVARPGAMGLDRTEASGNTDAFEDAIKNENSAVTGKDGKPVDEATKAWEDASGLDSSKAAAEARRENWDSKKWYQQVADPFVNGGKSVKDAFSEMKAHPFKTAAKTLPLVGIGAAAVMGGAPIVAAAGVAGTAFAAKKGVSAIGTQMGMDTKANRRAFESNAARRAEAIRKVEQQRANEADRIQQIRLNEQNSAEFREEMQQRVEAEKREDTERIKAEEAAAWQEYDRDSKGVEAFVAAHQQKNATTSPVAPKSADLA
ncbi:hypothetical protein [Aeromicrobium sp. 179-A 4D2 NHS]|uniref:hypothetical protein n=1 Tax=Aeromicrobium sp. 179-A 4D2 NHS TaxID=3142375 RepID=UPI0039A32DE9